VVIVEVLLAAVDFAGSGGLFSEKLNYFCGLSSPSAALGYHRQCTSDGFKCFQVFRTDPPTWPPVAIARDVDCAKLASVDPSKNFFWRYPISRRDFRG
jgi:hypothetical protein